MPSNPKPAACAVCEAEATLYGAKKYYCAGDECPSNAEEMGVEDWNLLNTAIRAKVAGAEERGRASCTLALEQAERIVQRTHPGAQSFFGAVHRALGRPGACPVVAGPDWVDPLAPLVELVNRVDRQVSAMEELAGLGESVWIEPGLGIKHMNCVLPFQLVQDLRAALAAHRGAQAPEPTNETETKETK